MLPVGIKKELILVISELSLGKPRANELKAVFMFTFVREIVIFNELLRVLRSIAREFHFDCVFSETGECFGLLEGRMTNVYI